MIFDVGIRLFFSGLIAVFIKGMVAWSGHSIAWVWAIVIALVCVFGGWLIIDGDVID